MCINYATAGNVGIGIPSPGSKLDVAGNINASGTINAVSGLNINGSPVTSSQWSTSGSNINYAPAGNVGIGAPRPGSKLDLARDHNPPGNNKDRSRVKHNRSPRYRQPSVTNSTHNNI